MQAGHCGGRRLLQEEARRVARKVGRGQEEQAGAECRRKKVERGRIRK